MKLTSQIVFKNPKSLMIQPQINTLQKMWMKKWTKGREFVRHHGKCGVVRILILKGSVMGLRIFLIYSVLCSFRFIAKLEQSFPHISQIWASILLDQSWILKHKIMGRKWPFIDFGCEHQCPSIASWFHWKEMSFPHGYCPHGIEKTCLPAARVPNAWHQMPDAL